MYHTLNHTRSELWSLPVSMCGVHGGIEGEGEAGVEDGVHAREHIVGEAWELGGSDEVWQRGVLAAQVVHRGLPRGVQNGRMVGW